MRARFVLPTLGLIASAGTAVSAQLVSQRVEGELRICGYRPNSYATPTGSEVQWRVPVGQLCPTRYPGADGPDGRLTGTYDPDSVRRRQETDRPIPSMATLTDTVREGSRTTCIYSYGGHNYRYVGGITLRCPLTPHFLPPGRANPEE